MRFRPLLILAAWLLSASLAQAAEPTAEQQEFFEKRIRPLLVERCIKCHGGEKTEAGLVLTSRAAILKGGDSGASAIAGKPDESLMLEVVNYKSDIQMPPDAKLPDADIAAIRQWVEASLPWPKEASIDPVPSAEHKFTVTDEQRKFWSFQPIKDAPPPAVKNEAWAQRPLDKFILARLEAEGIAPAAAADRRTLIRRVTFDLTGLPPTPEETEAFLNDKDAKAFERVIDRLLASPAYGQRWARHWLDVVRYTDSADARLLGGTGSEMDFTEAWRYRDWVVDAFNRDLPYDQFVQQQIAGDLLPGSGKDGFNREGIIATGMLAIGNWGGGDADKEKLLTDIADDQVDVVSRAFLGLTVSCARCHDHKFDPISTEDYYAMAGIFFSSHILRDPGPKTNGPNILRIPLASPQEMQQREQYEARLKSLAEQIEKLRDEALAAVAKEQLTKIDRYLVAVEKWDGQSNEQLQKLATDGQLETSVLRRWYEFLGRGDRMILDKPIDNVHGVAGLVGYRHEKDPPSLVANTTEKEAAFLTIKLPPRCVAVHPGPQTGIAIAWASPISGSVQVAGRVVDADSVCGNGVAWKLSLRKSGAVTEVTTGSITNGSTQDVRAESIEVAPGDLLELAILPNNEYSCDMTVVELNIAEQEGEKRTWNLTREWLADPRGGNPHADHAGRKDVWQCYELSAQATPQIPLAADSELAKSLAAKGERTQELKELRRVIELQGEGHPDAAWVKDLQSPRGKFWTPLRERDELLVASGRDELNKAKAELEALRRSPPPPVEFANGCLEGGCPQTPQAGIHNVRVHIRGRYDRLGVEVPRRLPVVLAGEKQTPVTHGSGRRELATWVGSDQQPLAARVIVNRIWQHHFGRGIVGTPNNYGKLGERPTHPELLDHLAKTLIDNGWSIKKLHREMLLSSTYQQASVNKASQQKDPDNRLWGRMNRRRLEAEAIRDSMLAVTNRLDPALGGKAVRGFDHNRRTLYAMTVRSDRSTFRELFDAADSTAIVDARVTSTVAPQALYFLNHPFTEQSSAALSTRVTQLRNVSTTERVERLHTWLYNRPATEQERAIAARVLGDSPDATRWQRYCHVLLCANEFVYID